MEQDVETNAPIKDKGLYASAETWKTLRSDPAFVELVRLARVANSLSLAWGPVLAPLEDQSPKARRERFAAFFFAAAVLHEGLTIAQALGRYYRQLPQYESGLAALARDPAVQVLNNGLLDRTRNQHVFHFDRDALAAGLLEFPENQEVVIATATDFIHGEIYFDLADDAFLGSLLGAPTVSENLARLEKLILEVAALFGRFMRAV
jgi:hypothetical protein